MQQFKSPFPPPPAPMIPDATLVWSMFMVAIGGIVLLIETVLK